MCPDGQSCVDFIRKMVKLGLWIQKVEFGILRSKGEGEKSWQLLGKFKIVQFIFVN